MAARPSTFDEYLASLSADKRAALEKLRKTIRAAAPRAEEYISYGLAAFRLDGKPLVALGATANHCAFYLMSSSTVEAHQEALTHHDTSTGTIRFPADQPLPAALVRKLVKARIAENESLNGKASKPRRAVKKSGATPEPDAARTDPAVNAFLAALDHPRKQELEALRQLILDISPEIREGIKWNSPSFRTTDYFATINVHAEDQLRLILHRGAKVKDSATTGVKIADPAGLLKWLAKDRCLVTLSDAQDFQAKRAALQSIVRDWIRQL